MSPIDVRDAGEIERAVTAFARSSNGGLIVAASALAAVHRDLIITLAARHRLPAVYSHRFFVTAGGLISYGPDPIDPYRRAAGYVDRILKGEKPADLPVQAPTKYELVINLKTAKALGLDRAADAARPRRRGDRISRNLLQRVMSPIVQVFARRQSRGLPRAHAAGVRKAPRHEIAAGGSAAAVPQALWGFGHGRELEAGRFARAVRVEREYNLNVTARILLNGEFTFCPIHHFNELRVARERDRQLCVMNCPITFG